MKKTWGEIRKETLSLGFDKESTYNKLKDSFISAYNWAVNHLASVTGSIVDTLEIDVSESGQVQVFDLHELAKDKGYSYLSLRQPGIVDSNMNRIDWAYIAENRMLFVPAGCSGEVTVWYSRSSQPIATSADDSTECELPYKWAMLVPYYMANRLYLDDDASKAGYYWNLAEDMKRDMLEKEKAPQITVISEIDIDGWCI